MNNFLKIIINLKFKIAFLKMSKQSFDICILSNSKIPRFFGALQGITLSSKGQGNIPFEYALKSISTDKSCEYPTISYSSAVDASEINKVK